MKICYFDAFSGISGDMTVGALLDAGADFEALREALTSLQLPAEFQLEKTKRRGIAASKFTVTHAEQKKHRHLPHIVRMIEAGSFPDRPKRNALAVFGKLAEAEAKSHDVPVEKVHFHEVGAIDSICDVVGACVALDLLGVEEVYCSKINVGSGTVETEHGTLPVPAPATTELLRSIPVYAAGPETELTTPTGAALAATLSTKFGALPAVNVTGQGFGAGDKDFPGRANVLRVLLGDRSAATEATEINVIETNIDDASPQVLSYAMERLFEAGALDVTLTPAYMKKNRPGTVVTIVAAPDQTEQLAAILFSETTTLGLRVYGAERRVLARDFLEVQTPYGAVRVKYTPDGTFAPEYEDCRRAAVAGGIPLRTVIAEASEAFRKEKKS